MREYCIRLFDIKEREATVDRLKSLGCEQIRGMGKTVILEYDGEQNEILNVEGVMYVAEPVEYFS